MTFKEFSDRAHAMVETAFPGSYHAAAVEETRNRGDRSELHFKVWLSETHDYIVAPNPTDCLTALAAKLAALKGVQVDTSTVGDVTCESIA